MLAKLFMQYRKYYKEELIFYTKYHKNSINWYIHAICAPLEWFSWLLLISSLHLEYFLSSIVAIYYIALNFSFINVTSAVSLLMMSYCATTISFDWNIWQKVYISIIIQLIAWFCQVNIGHFLIERNSPAMTNKLNVNSIILSLLLAWDTRCGNVKL
jgi:uncharacterized membrane protein YGL010W